MLNIALWHTKSYFDIRTLAKYWILTFEILFCHSNSDRITYFYIRDPVLTFEFRRNIAFWHSKCYFDIRSWPNITFWHLKSNFDIRTRAEYRSLTFKIEIKTGPEYFILLRIRAEYLILTIWIFQFSNSDRFILTFEILFRPQPIYHSISYFVMQLWPNIAFWHSKSYYDFRTGAEYLILTFEIIF